MRAFHTHVIALTAVVLLAGAVTANAQPRRAAVVVVPRAEVVRPFFYDPFWGPWYPYGYMYPYAVSPESDVRTHVTPKDAAVYVDGFYAGVARMNELAWRILSHTETGRLRWYAAGIAAGSVVFIAVVLFL